MNFSKKISAFKLVKSRLNTLFLVIFLVSCATFGDRTIYVTEAQIQQKLNEKLVVPIQLLKVFDVNLSNSIVKFEQSTGRMQTTFDTVLNSALFNKSVIGKLSISGKLRFDALTQSVILDEPKIDQFNIDGANSKQNEIVDKLTKTLGGEMLNGLTLYSLQPEDLKFSGTNYQPKDIQITNKGLKLTLTPQR